jgi:outer membrane protein assembly factor BamB
MKFPFCVTRKKHGASFRSLLLAIAPLWLMLAAANTPAHAQGTPSPGDWTQFLRDNMQRWNPYETVLGVSNVGMLGLKWQNAIVGHSSPAVVNGVMYIGSDDGNVYALSAGTGAKLWSFATGGPVSSSPAVANGVVYVGSTNDNVYALNAATGAKVWRFTTFFGVNSSPAVVNGVVYVGVNGSIGAGGVIALSTSTGALLWSFTTGGEVVSSPAVANGVVYVNSDDGNLYALSANTGAKLWSSTIVAGGVIDGLCSPAVANGVVYIGAYEPGSPFNGFIYALNASNGAKLWSFAAAPGTFIYGSPAVANGVVYVGTDEHVLYALNASTGAELWSFQGAGGVDTSPAVANGVVYIQTLGTNNLYALNASTGAELWSFATGGDAYSSPTVVNGMVYVESGSLLAFGLGSADLFLRIQPTPTTVHQGDLITYAFPVWNLGPSNAVHEVLNTQVPPGTTLDYIRISGTPGLGTCTAPPYQGTGKIVCYENSAMAPNTTWTVRVVVKVVAPAGTVITESAATLADTFDPNLANNTATVSTTVQ